jgi:hypothetical protein
MIVDKSGPSAGRVVWETRWCENGIGGSWLLGGGLIVDLLSMSSGVLALGLKEVRLLVVRRGAVAGNIRAVSPERYGIEGSGAVVGSIVMTSNSLPMISMSVKDIGPGPRFLLDRSSLARCFIGRAASLGLRTTSAPVPSPIEFVELDRTCAGISGKGGGDWVENAQNFLGDLGGKSLAVWGRVGGGGGDLGLRGGSAVSDPNDEVESRCVGGGG